MLDSVANSPACTSSSDTTLALLAQQLAADAITANSEAPNREDCPSLILEPHVRTPLTQVNSRKVVGLDGVTGRVLNVCADQGTKVLTSHFNKSLAYSMVPTCFKRSTIAPESKKLKPWLLE